MKRAVESDTTKRNVTRNATVNLVVCVLMTDYANWDIWQRWASKARDNIGFVSHPLPHLASTTPFSVKAPIVTKRGSPSLVEAELLLYRTAVERFPALRLCLFVSGDTVPIQGANDMLQYYRRDPRSHFKEYTSMSSYNAVKKRAGKKPRWVRRYYVADQQKALARTDIDFLLSKEGLEAVRTLGCCVFTTPRRQGAFHYDEIVIPTVLYNKFLRPSTGTLHFNNSHILGKYAAPGFHCAELSDTDFQILRADIQEDGNIQIIRKVAARAASSVAARLSSSGVIP